ncbi:MAG TPA: DUF6647 family protein [Burkholderiales bacterium]|nr:DUF6647 family protein [Burkholderiales bacterium]
MDQSALVSLVAELFAAIKLVSGYPGPAVLPQVHALPQVEIQRRLCERRPCRIKAYYHPDGDVIVDDALDLEHDAFDRSILLHELVHHLQKVTGRFGSVTSFCSRRISEELEAYEIQNRYLAEVHASRRAMVSGWTGRCSDDGALSPLPAPLPRHVD